jgi:hypothetical protein
MRQHVLLPGLLGVGLALVLGSATARGDYFTTAIQSTSIPLTATNWDNTSRIQGLNPFEVTKFDHTQYDKNGQTAVLTGMTVTLSYEFQNLPTIQFVNTSTITVKTDMSMYITSPNGKTNMVASPTLTNTAQQNSSSPSAIPLYDQGGHVSGSFVDTATLNQFNFTGSNGSTLSLPVFAQATTTFTSSSGNGSGTAATAAAASIYVAYFYTLIAPEPSSFVLMGLGLLGLVAVARKRLQFGLKKSPTA